MTHRVLLSGSGANTLSAFSTPCVRMHGTMLPERMSSTTTTKPIALATARTRSVSPLLADERKRGADDLLSGKFNAGQHTILSSQHPMCCFANSKPAADKNRPPVCFLLYQNFFFLQIQRPRTKTAALITPTMR